MTRWVTNLSFIYAKKIWLCNPSLESVFFTLMFFGCSTCLPVMTTWRQGLLYECAQFLGHEWGHAIFLLGSHTSNTQRLNTLDTIGIHTCKYTQSPLIRLTAKWPALASLKNSSNLEAHRFLILQAWTLAVS